MISRSLVLVVAFFVAAGGAASASTAPEEPTTLRLSADRVTFYYDRFLVEADGNVRVQSSDGTTTTGEAFSMDLKLNRFVVAGNARISNAAGSQSGAALADFLDFNRVYFVPVTSEPDRWTFADGDYTHPIKGRIMPGDTFYLPDLSKDKPFLESTSAVIGAREFARFTGSRVDVLNGMGAYVPLPSFYVNFSANPALGTNSLAGASFDGTYQFAGNANSISAAHVRYDPVNHLYGSFEQHLASEKSYAVFSVNPLTRPSKFWNLILSDTPDPRLQFRTFTQLHTFQYGLSQPLESSQFTNLQITKALKASSLQLNYTLQNLSLLAPPANFPVVGYYGNPADGHTFVPNHPAYVNLGVTTNDVTPLHVPEFVFHYRYGVGMAHDAYPLQTVGGSVYRTVASDYVGATLFSKPIPLRRNAYQWKNINLTAVVDKQRTWNSSHHYVDLTNSTASLSRFFDQFDHTAAYLQYNVLNEGDFYGALQNVAYPTIVRNNGVSNPGYAAFHGFATLRTLSLGLVYQNRDVFTFALTGRKHVDFPRPVPGFFAYPQLNNLGQYAYSNYLGQPPYDLDADVRFRVNPHMSLDFSQIYYFRYPGAKPVFLLQVSQ